MERPSPFDIIGILPDWAIKAHIKEGLIRIDPLPENWEDLIDQVTIDFHLGRTLRVFKNDGLNTIDTKHSTRKEIEAMTNLIELKPGQPFVLTKGKFVTAVTQERLTLPDNIVGRVDGKSTLARMGVIVHATAARFDPGYDGCPVLEFGTHLESKEILLYEGRPICAFEFNRLMWPVEKVYNMDPRKYGSDKPEAPRCQL